MKNVKLGNVKLPVYKEIDHKHTYTLRLKHFFMLTVINMMMMMMMIMNSKQTSEKFNVI